MSKKANAGELRTKCFFKSAARTTGTNGSVAPSYTNVFGQDESHHDKPAYVKWVNVHGTEVLTALQMTVKESATLTMRYSPLITDKLVVFKGVETVPYEIISVDNVEERNEWLELKVQRKALAR